jgi:hypothetical protein
LERLKETIRWLALTGDDRIDISLFEIWHHPRAGMRAAKSEQFVGQ